MNAESISTVEKIVEPFKFPVSSYEYKVTPLRECPVMDSMSLCDQPDKAADYWRNNVVKHPYFNPECECCVILILNTKRRVKGHYLVSIGILDSLLLHPREVFKLAIVTSAAAIIVMHNHPSGDPLPSEADIKVTREIIQAGKLLRIELLDHVIMGNPSHTSLRALGYFQT